VTLSKRHYEDFVKLADRQMSTETVLMVTAYFLKDNPKFDPRMRLR